MEDRPFHEVGNLFPGETHIEWVPPDTSVSEALRIMLENRYSQLPVKENSIVRGVFSLWSLAHLIATAPGLNIQDLLVEDVMETLPSVTVTDSLHSVFGLLEQHEALLVDSPHGLQAIATSFNVLHYFVGVAQPFILLQEIELALRSLIELCAPGPKLKECIDQALVKFYESKSKEAPTDLNEMTFGDYRSIVTSKQNWGLFEGILGRNRALVSARLEAIRRIRNDVFHFRPIEDLDHKTLAIAREWLLDKVRRVSREEVEDVG